MHRSNGALRSRIMAVILAAALLAGVFSSFACSSSDTTAYNDPGDYNDPDWNDPDWNDPDWDDPDWNAPEQTDDPDWDDPDWEDPDWEDPEYTGDPDVVYNPGEAPELDFVVADLSEPLEIDTYSDSEFLDSRSLMIYDADYLDLFFSYPSVSANEIIAHIDANPKIGPQYKQLLKTFVNSIAQKYPDADMRPLDFNIQTLEIVECDEFELAMHTLSLDAYGCYVNSENTIYVPKDYTYRPGTWEYQVIMHEFGHAARTVWRDDPELQLLIQLSSDSFVIPEEALNSIFTVSLFDYEERDIAYQLQSNMFLILVDCCDDYTLTDYINHSLSYFAHKLDLQNGNNNYATAIMKLIEEQRTDWSNNDYERPQEVYYPIYHYLTKMYLDKYASSGMSSGEIDALVAKMLDTVMFDVPEEYNIDTAEFYRYAHEYFGA